MRKSIHSTQYRAFLHVLRDAREGAGLTQADLAKLLHESQSFVSKCERGERRIDVIEAYAFCRAIGIPLQRLIAEFERAIGHSARRSKRRRHQARSP